MPELWPGKLTEYILYAGSARPTMLLESRLFVYASHAAKPAYYYLPAWATRSSNDDKLILVVTWGE